jgi:hypothetical protein
MRIMMMLCEIAYSVEGCIGTYMSTSHNRKTLDEMRINMKILHMTLKKKWFDLILSGVKTEEYRKIKSYWDTRLSKEYDIIRFKNGYNKNSPVFDIELIGIKKGLGNVEWGGSSEVVYILQLGKIHTSSNNEYIVRSALPN